MSDWNAEKNRVVWVDIPVVDVERASTFYAAVLAIDVHREEFNGIKFSVLEHSDGNGGCLVPKPGEVSASHGILVYLNTEGRIRDAVERATAGGGQVIEPVTPIGPHGFRAVVVDSEGNRIALHSTVDG